MPADPSLSFREHWWISFLFPYHQLGVLARQSGLWEESWRMGASAYTRVAGLSANLAFLPKLPGQRHVLHFGFPRESCVGYSPRNGRQENDERFSVLRDGRSLR